MYEQVDQHLQSLQQQIINDQAYFVLAWGQLEVGIEKACRDAIRYAQLHEDWRYRRAWSLYKPDSHQPLGLSFKNRLTLVLEKDTDDWKTTIKYYKLRNQIAHGTLQSERINVSSVIQDFYHIMLSLAGN